MGKKYQLHHGTFDFDYMRIDGLCTMPDRFNDGIDEFSITIDERLKGLARLDTIIHELLHAEHPDMSEKDVARTATNLARVLFGEGYRERLK